MMASVSPLASPVMTAAKPESVEVYDALATDGSVVRRRVAMAIVIDRAAKRVSMKPP
jgi:hypothetical protein